MRWAFALLAVALAIALCGATAPKAKASECEELGFTANLACSTCGLLPTFVQDEGLLEECRLCCSEEATEDNHVYDHARLEMDKSYVLGLAYYHPGLYHFLRGSSFVRFPGLQVVDKSGAKPSLVFEDEEGKPALSTPLDGWKEETIVEYLEAKLTNGEGIAVEGAHVPRWLRGVVDKKQ